MRSQTEADFIRYAGLAVAFAGIAIATPDGVAEVLRRLRAALTTMRGKLARFLPFLRRSANVHLQAADAGGAADNASVVKRRAWEPDATEAQKTEILHQQMDFLIEEVDSFKTDVAGRFSAVQRDLQDAQAHFAAVHGELKRAIEARERRAAQVDARGLWPIWLGILLTGIPAELAQVAIVGYLVTAAAAAITLMLGVAVFRGQEWKR